MDPITLSMLVAAGASALKAAPKLFKSKYEKGLESRLDDLVRKEEMGALGLTDQERASLQSEAEAPTRMAAEATKQEQQRYLAGGGAASGVNLLQAQMAGENLAQAAQEAAAEVEKKDAKQRLAQEQEMNYLEAGLGQYAAERQASLVSIPEAALEAGLGTAAQQTVIQGPKAPSKEAVAALSGQYGVNEKTALGLLELVAYDPEIANKLSSMGLKPAGTQ